MRFHLSFARASILAVAVSFAAAACSDKTTTGPSATPRAYDQVQRLGNPLVSEVFFAKRNHEFHGSIGPDGDVAAFTTELKGFVASFRPNATTLQASCA